MRFRNSDCIDLGCILTGLFFLLYATVSRGGPRHLLEDALPDKMLSGHTDGVLAVDFFPDNTRIASGAHDNTVRLWDISGRLLHTFRGHARAVCSVSVSPDGSRIASGSLDHAAFVWDVKSGELIAQLLGHTGPVHVAFLPDGKLLTGGGDGTLRIWDVDAEKELWRSTPDECVRVMTVTPDGHFAAYGACDSTLRVWDLRERKLIGKYGEFDNYSVDAVGLTPDGKHVYRHLGVDGLKGWNVADGKPLELPASFADAASIVLSRDGTRMIDGNRSVVETESGRLIERYRNNSAEMPRAFAFSPDGRRFAIAGGGWGFDQNYTWKPGRQNLIQIFNFRDPSADLPPPGPPDGPISWDVIPLQVRRPGKPPVPLGPEDYPAQWPTRRSWKIIAAQVELPGAPAAPMDLLCCAYAVLFHRDQGILDEIVHDTEAQFSDIAWDGKQVWVASLKRGITVFDPAGAVVGSIGNNRGLPKSAVAMFLHVLSPGRILVAGADEVENGGGWCAVVEESDVGGAADFSVKVFFRESQLKKWVEPVRGVRPSGLMFRPLLITEPPPAGGERSVWVICVGVPRSDGPILRVNTATLAWDEYNFLPKKFENNRTGHRVERLDAEAGLLWLDSAHALCGWGTSVLQVTLGAEFCDTFDSRSFCSLLEYRGRPEPMLPFGSQIYLPRSVWYRVDPKTQTIRRIGPGVRAEGQLIGDDLEYFVSARLGLAAFSPTDSCFYRISLDSAHPLSVRATGDPLTSLAQPPGDGVVEVGTLETIFRSGLGDLVFRGGHLETPGDFHGGGHLGVRMKEREKGFTDFTINVISRRLEDPAERGRAGMTDADVARYHAVLARCNQLMTAKIDVERLEKMYRDFEPSVGGPREHEAAKPLLDEARKLGDRWAADANEYLTLTRGAFTTRQWRLMQYEDPDGKE